MAQFDTLIKGGTVVDGTGVPRYRADVGIKDGKITDFSITLSYACGFSLATTCSCRAEASSPRSIARSG